MTIHDKYTLKEISVDEKDMCDFEGLLGSGLGWIITCQVSVGGQVATNWTNIFCDEEIYSLKFNQTYSVIFIGWIIICQVSACTTYMVVRLFCSSKLQFGN